MFSCYGSTVTGIFKNNDGIPHGGVACRHGGSLVANKFVLPTFTASKYPCVPAGAPATSVTIVGSSIRTFHPRSPRSSRNCSLALSMIPASAFSSVSVFPAPADTTGVSLLFGSRGIIVEPGSIRPTEGIPTVGAACAGGPAGVTVAADSVRAPDGSSAVGSAPVPVLVAVTLGRTDVSPDRGVSGVVNVSDACGVWGKFISTPVAGRAHPPTNMTVTTSVATASRADTRPGSE